MNWNSLLSGLIGAIVGAIASYFTQSALVKKQIAASEATQRQFLGLLEQARSYFAERSKQYSSSLENIASALKQLADQQKAKD